MVGFFRVLNTTSLHAATLQGLGLDRSTNPHLKIQEEMTPVHMLPGIEGCYRRWDRQCILLYSSIRTEIWAYVFGSPHSDHSALLFC